MCRARAASSAAPSSARRAPPRVLVVLTRGDVEAGVRVNAAALDRVVIRVVERDQLAIDSTLGKIEACSPADGLERRLAGALERLDERPELPVRRGPVET